MSHADADDVLHEAVEAYLTRGVPKGHEPYMLKGYARIKRADHYRRREETEQRNRKAFPSLVAEGEPIYVSLDRCKMPYYGTVLQNVPCPVCGKDFKPEVVEVGKRRTYCSLACTGKALGAQRAALTHCKRGHELAGENLRINTQGKRVCKKCERIRDRERRANARLVRTG